MHKSLGFPLAIVPILELGDWSVIVIFLVHKLPLLYSCQSGDYFGIGNVFR
jgi:hypothetical protein